MIGIYRFIVDQPVTKTSLIILITLFASCSEPGVDNLPSFDISATISNISYTVEGHSTFSVDFSISYSSANYFIVDGSYAIIYGHLELFIDGEWLTGRAFEHNYPSESSGTYTGVINEGVLSGSSTPDWYASEATKMRLRVKYGYNRSSSGLKIYDEFVSNDLYFDDSIAPENGIDEDIYEPDNTINSANQISTNGIAQQHTLHEGDYDYLFFNVTQGKSYRIDLDYNESLTAPLVELSNSSNSYIAHNSTYIAGCSTDYINWVSAETDVNYIKVFRSSYIDSYSLSVSDLGF